MHHTPLSWGHLICWKKVLDLDITTGSHMLWNAMKSKVKVRSVQSVTIEPNTEVVANGGLPKKSLMGVQGVASVHKSLFKEVLLLARSVTTIPANLPSTCSILVMTSFIWLTFWCWQILLCWMNTSITCFNV